MSEGIEVSAPLLYGQTEKCFYVLTPSTLAAFTRDNGLWGENLAEAKAKVADAEPGTYWIMKVATVADTQVVPARTRVRFSPTTSRAPRQPKVKRGRRAVRTEAE